MGDLIDLNMPYRDSAKPQEPVAEFIGWRDTCPYCGETKILPCYPSKYCKDPGINEVITMHCNGCRNRWDQEALWVYEGRQEAEAKVRQDVEAAVIPMHPVAKWALAFAVWSFLTVLIRYGLGLL